MNGASPPGQKGSEQVLGTIVRHAEGAHFDAGLRAFFAYRDLGVREASGGAFAAAAHVHASSRLTPGPGCRDQPASAIRQLRILLIAGPTKEAGS